jgi:hypothetical protein
MHATGKNFIFRVLPEGGIQESGVEGGQISNLILFHKPSHFRPVPGPMFAMDQSGKTRDAI